MRCYQNRAFVCVAMVCAAFLVPARAAEAGEHRLGIGLHAWTSLDDFEDEFFSDIEDDGFAWVASYQYIPRGLFRFELDVEYAADGFGGATDSSLSAIGYALVGGTGFYAGAGIGATFSDTFSGDISDPFYAARLGYELEVLAGLSVDIHANYRANAFNELDEAETDVITVGVQVRFSL